MYLLENGVDFHTQGKVFDLTDGRGHACQSIVLQKNCRLRLRSCPELKKGQEKCLDHIKYRHTVQNSYTNVFYYDVNLLDTAVNVSDGCSHW